MLRTILTFLITAVLFLTATGCQKTAEDKPLRVGMDLSYAPFEMIDEHGEPDGISVGIARALSSYLHRRLEIENIPFIGLLSALQTGKIDLIISSMSDTPERRKSIAFSDPYFEIRLAMLAYPGSKVTSKNTLDQPDVTVAVRQGSTGQLWAHKNLKQAKILVFDAESTAVLEVLQKKADVFLYDQMSVWKHHQQHPTETVAILTPLNTEKLAIGLRSSDDSLRDQVNLFLKQFHDRKGFDQLGDKYFHEQKEAFKKEGIPIFY